MYKTLYRYGKPKTPETAQESEKLRREGWTEELNDEVAPIKVVAVPPHHVEPEPVQDKPKTGKSKS